MAVMWMMQETENYIIFLCQLIRKLIIYIKKENSEIIS